MFILLGCCSLFDSLGLLCPFSCKGRVDAKEWENWSRATLLCEVSLAG